MTGSPQRAVDSGDTQLPLSAAVLFAVQNIGHMRNVTLSFKLSTFRRARVSDELLCNLAGVFWTDSNRILFVQEAQCGVPRYLG